MSLAPDQRAALFAACPLFTGIGDDALATLAERGTEVDFPAGRVIARQGEIGTGFFVVVRGQVRVIRDGAQIATMGPGDFFGELSVLDRQPRNASVIAETPTTCLALASWDLEAVLMKDAALTLTILRGVVARLRATTDAARQ
jgi:CRP-like cAMP-binding protein